MKNADPSNPQTSTDSATAQDMGFSPWKRLKTKRISYLTLPLIVMATVTEIVILATGWKYQQIVCLPKGMGVTFFGIGPIGATILAVELLKLPLAIWTASRQGWQKFMMLVVGLPVICLLTFQLVKDMAVYEMGVALAPASQMLEEADKEEIKIAQLKGELAGIEAKKADRAQKLTELAATQAKAKANLEEALKRNDDSRQDAISLTDYQKQQLSEVQSREATLIKQFDADAQQLTKDIADLRARRETELPLATKWNAEQARIDNAYNAKLAAYNNKKAQYEKDKKEYEQAGYLKRLVLGEPVDPGVPPVRENNTFLKPLVVDIESEITNKESQLLAVNTKRRDAVAQVEAEARQMRQEFDSRSITKRAEADHKRQDLLAAAATLDTQWTAEQKQINQDYQEAAQKIDGINAEIDTCTKNAEGFYEAREASIKNTQVYRIATTVEIIRGLLMGQHPVSIKATAKERGDLYTDQISMVRIWVYPVLAFIVAYLPTLLVEIGFSTIFYPEKRRPAHRLGFFGRRLHWLYTRAGRQKILRAERVAREATAQIADRDKAVAAANAAAEEAVSSAKLSAEQSVIAATASAEQAVAAANAAVELARADKEAGLQAAREAVEAAAAENAAQLERNKEEWVAKLASMADSLNRTVVEKDALRDLQRSEIERQIQMRQNAWSDRLTQLRQELDDQRTAAEAERTALIQEHHQKLMEVAEDCKTQVIQARREKADAEFVGMEKLAKLSHDLKQAQHARDEAEAQLKHQADSFSLKLAQAQEDTSLEIEKAVRQEKHRFERERLDFEKTLRQREEELEHQLKKNGQELSAAFEARLLEEKTRVEQEARRRETELERQSEARIREQEARGRQEIQQLEAAALARFQEREQQLQAQAEVRFSDAQAQAEQALRRRESELERQLDVQTRDADSRLRQELQQKELAFQARLKQRETELTALAAGRETELQNQWAADLRAREEEFDRQADARVRAVETRLGYEAQQKEEAFQSRMRQREHQLQSQFEARQAEWQTQSDQKLHSHEQEWERNAEARARATDSRWSAELQQKEELFQSKLRQRDEQWQAKLNSARIEWQAKSEQELLRRDAESADAGLRAAAELEAKLRQEMQQKEEAALAKARQREQELTAQLAAQAEAHQTAQSQWDTETREKTRVALEHFKALQGRTEKERDDARALASERLRQVQHLEKKLTDVSMFLNGWKNGNHLVEVDSGR